MQAVVRAPPVSAAQARYALLAAFFCTTLVESASPLGGLLLLNVLFSFLTFLWYCRDRDASGRRRSLARNIGVITLPFITIPWYLVRHQPLRGRIRALLRFLGFVVLILLATLLGAMASGMLAGLLGRDFDQMGVL
jgi:hypothetical protein